MSVKLGFQASPTVITKEEMERGYSALLATFGQLSSELGDTKAVALLQRVCYGINMSVVRQKDGGLRLDCGMRCMVEAALSGDNVEAAILAHEAAHAAQDVAGERGDVEACAMRALEQMDVSKATKN